MRALLTRLTERLRQGADPFRSPRLEAEMLLASVLGRERISLLLHPEIPVPEEARERLEKLAARRLEGEPMAYLLGRREFWGRSFAVGPGVLIPRPETELAAEIALDLLPAGKPLRFLDLCAGSGCLGISLALERPAWRGLLLEKYPVPLACAARNAAELGADTGILQADVFFPPLRERTFGLVTANPPYIAPEERDEVMPQVLAHEPAEALFAGEHGLAVLEACVSLAARVLVPGGLVVLEHGCRQGEAVRRLLARKNFRGIETKKDLAGLDRASLGRV